MVVEILNHEYFGGYKGISVARGSDGWEIKHFSPWTWENVSVFLPFSLYPRRYCWTINEAFNALLFSPVPTKYPALTF
jgi:hypothetical protein